ncbi:hypothetical protein HYN49_02860 [Flavobacterium pallidum]|uniref:Uncharacterized protein n=2 Tax=Flavobacterium pallidum TaxID=2172098 RepID=A0A2S1SEV0_9FLAO|nr:hypothetical protein HYN49_02860 [Flavobacterium pallidum]
MTKVVINNYNATFMVWHFRDGEKDVRFIPMAHVNKPEKFARIKTLVDSFRMKGYAIYYEGVEMSKSIDSTRRDSILRKFRTIIGMVPNNYADKNNKSTKQFAVKGFIGQTAQNTGVDKVTDINADLHIDELVSIFEKKNGNIKLSECDWQTKLNDKYRCRKIDRKKMDGLVLHYRNEHLSRLVAIAPEKKIVILYGAMHEKNFEEYLQKYNPNWERVREGSNIRW